MLQPSPQQAGQRASSSGNGQTATWHAVAPSAGPGMPFQPALVALAWPVQALLESLRRHYLGN